MDGGSKKVQRRRRVDRAVVLVVRMIDRHSVHGGSASSQRFTLNFMFIYLWMAWTFLVVMFVFLHCLAYRILKYIIGRFGRIHT